MQGTPLQMQRRLMAGLPLHLDPAGRVPKILTFALSASASHVATAYSQWAGPTVELWFIGSRLLEILDTAL